MAERIKKHWNLKSAISLGLIATLMGCVTMFSFTGMAFGQTAQNITVTATVQEYISLQTSSTSVALSPDLVSSAGVAQIASSTWITLTVNTSSADGYTVYAKGAGNGLASESNYIYTAAASGTVAAGTDAFGLQATSTVMTVHDNFLKTGNGIGSASSTTNTEIARKTTPGANETVQIRFMASCDAAQAAGTYTDTITITATPAIP